MLLLEELARSGIEAVFAYEHVGLEHWLRIPVAALTARSSTRSRRSCLSAIAGSRRATRASPRCCKGPRVPRVRPLLLPQLPRSKTGNVHHCYRCSGADSFRRPEGRVCAARPVRIDEVDEPVWAQVLALLENPELIKTEIDRQLQALRSEHPATRRRDGLQRDLTRAQNALRRLIDGYQEQLITLELRARTPELRRREATLRAELDALDTQLHDAETYLKQTETLHAFRARLSTNAENLTVEQRQQIVRSSSGRSSSATTTSPFATQSRFQRTGSQAVRYCIRNVKALRRAIKDVFGEHTLVHRAVATRSETSATCSPSATGR